MSEFKKLYESLFRELGYPLSKRTAMPEQRIINAETRLRITVPSALRDYYLVAGNETRFNQCANRLLTPDSWILDSKRLIFMEENQGVLWWGMSLRKPVSDNPMIFQGLNDEPIAWYSERRRCAGFLDYMLFYHALNDGLPYRGNSDIPGDFNYRLDENDWKSHGEIGFVTVYSRGDQVICANPPGKLPFMKKWTMTAAARTKTSFKSLAKEVGLNFR